MKTLRIYPENPNPRDIALATETLRNGGIIIYPTDTIYAIGCDALNVRAVEQICRIKGIDPKKVNLSIVRYSVPQYHSTNTTPNTDATPNFSPNNTATKPIC